MVSPLFCSFAFYVSVTHSQPWPKNIEFPQPSISSAPDIQQSTLSGLNDLGSLEAHDLPSVLSLEGNPTPHHSAYIIHFISSRIVHCKIEEVFWFVFFFLNPSNNEICGRSSFFLFCGDSFQADSFRADFSLFAASPEPSAL